MPSKLNWCSMLTLVLALCFPTLLFAKYTPEQVKAVYIFRIANFVHWNNEELKSQINVCVPDNPEIRSILIDITKGKKVRKKPFNVTDQNCDLLFISQTQNLSLMLAQTTDTINIGDLPKFTAKGGAIELVVREGRVKPIVNLDNVGSYTISSNFLRVADVIGDRK